MDDGAVETEASWSPTGQWHILCYSVTRDVIYYGPVAVLVYDRTANHRIPAALAGDGTVDVPYYREHPV